MDKEKILEFLQRASQIDFEELIFSEKGDLPSGKWLALQNFNAVRISIPLSGSVVQHIHFNGKWQQITCPVGRALVFLPMTWTAGSNEHPEMENLGIILNPGYLRLIASNLAENQQQQLPDYFFHQYTGIGAATRELFKTLTLWDNKYPSKVAGTLLTVLLKLLYTDLSADSLEKIPRSNILWRQIHSFLLEHFRDDICREDIAQKFKISVVYLSKLFTLYSSEGSFNQTLNSIRLNAAELLLRNSSIECRQICRDCGFNSPSYFSALFERKYQLTPLLYRKNRKKVKVH